MTSSFRDRRLQLIQKQQADALASRLTSFDVHDFVRWGDLPDWLPDSLDTTRRAGAVPDSTLPLKADDTALHQWLADFLTESGIRDRFYLLTGIDNFPWLDLAPREPGWLDELIELKGPTLILLSEDKTTLVVFYEEEYQYEAFRRTG
jgi:hypothetical protein